MTDTVKYTVLKPCIACKKEIHSVFPQSMDREGIQAGQPSNAVRFSGSGTYGSEFDDMNENVEYAIHVCDECLRKAIENNEVLVHKQTQTHQYLEAKTYYDDVI